MEDFEYLNKTCAKCNKTANWAGYQINAGSAEKCPWCLTPYEGVINTVKPTTQKAKGIMALAEHYGPTVGHTLASYGLWSVKEPIKMTPWLANHLKGGHVFARPCPPSPEHGFVESRVVKSEEELEALRIETLAANPNSEIILVPLIKADWNAVWTPELLAVGKGHDGATAGKDTVSIPLMGQCYLDKDLIYQHAGVAEGKGPYIEAVGLFKDPGPWCSSSSLSGTLVQLRGGPKLESGVSDDCIPEAMTVSEVLQTNGEDLLEWAKVIRAIKGKPGIVVYHPGGSPVDHYSVHCRENQVALVTTFKPEIGQVIEPTSAIEPLDPQAALLGLSTVDRLDCAGESGGRSYGWFTTLSLLINHNSGVLRGKNAFWVGVAAGALIKLGSAACRGESRHAHNLPHGGNNKPDIYGFYGKRSLSFHRAAISRLAQLLHYGFGPPDGSHGFGGPKWSLCAAALCPVFNAIRDLAIEPTPEHASELLQSLNIAINQAHNGGWWLNKFVNQEAFSYVPQGRPEWACYAAPAILTSWAGRTVGQERLERFIKTVQGWPVSEIKPLKWRKASLDIGPGSFVIDLKPATAPNSIRVTVPLTKVQIESLASQEGQVEIDDGAINLKLPGGVDIPIWKEKGIIARMRDPNKRSTW